MPLSKSALAYRNNPASAKKHAEYNTKRNKSKERTAYRVELNRERRKRGIYGKGGPDMSHTESGKLVEEKPSKNRGRNGAGGKSTKKTDSLKSRSGKGKKCGESFIPRNHKCGADAPSSGITPKKAVILGAGAALGVVAALRARSLWTPALSRLYAEARKANRPWDTYAKKLKEDLRDLDVRRFAKARNDLKKRICSRGDARLDAWSECKFAIGEASSFGRVLKHPNQPIVFKVPKENYYVPVSNGKQMTGTKQLHRRVAKMFDQEAENLQLANRLKVDSPRLEGYNPNTRTIAMEFLQGFDTYRSIRRKFPNLDRAVEFQLFANLRKMHTNGLVHMDLHPGNVLVNPATKRISIIDFGTSERGSNLAPFDFLDLVHTEVTTVTKLTLPLSVKQKDLILDSRDKYLPVIKGAKAYYTTVPDAQIPNNIEQFYQDVGTILLSS
jgi:serine/threonine protein kinase